MEKVSDIVKDALFEISILGVEAPAEPNEVNIGMRYLNRMLTALDARGVSLGFTEVSQINDDVTVPAGANEAIVDLLAMKMWRQFNDDGAPVPADLAQRAREGLKTLYHIGVDVGAMEYPSTLPIGSGNEEDANVTDKFYDDLEATILAETNGSISLEDST